MNNEKKCLSLEEIEEIIECPPITPAKYEPVWWVGKGRKELAKAIYDALPSKGMVEKENICIHYVPISQCPVCAPKEGSSADREQFSKELFNSLGGCIIKETTGETIWDRWIAKLSAKPSVPSVDELINTIQPFLFGYSQGENPTIKISQAIHQMLSKEMK